MMLTRRSCRVGLTRHAVAIAGTRDVPWASADGAPGTARDRASRPRTEKSGDLPPSFSVEVDSAVEAEGWVGREHFSAGCGLAFPVPGGTRATVLRTKTCFLECLTEPARWPPLADAPPPFRARTPVPGFPPRKRQCLRGPKTSCATLARQACGLPNLQASTGK